MVMVHCPPFHLMSRMETQIKRIQALLPQNPLMCWTLRDEMMPEKAFDFVEMFDCIWNTNIAAVVVV